MRPVTVNVGPLQSASAQIIRTSATVAGAGAITFNGSAYSSTTGIATLDVARRLLFTSAGNDTGITFTVVGTNWSGQRITETLTGVSATTVQSVLDYLTLISAQASGASASNVSIGTSGVASSPWVRFDEYTGRSVSIGTAVNGTVNYTVQQSMDDPNSPTNPTTPQGMTWLSSADSNVVGALSAQQSNYFTPPIFGRILLNSGSGAVTATFVQIGSGV